MLRTEVGSFSGKSLCLEGKNGFMKIILQIFITIIFIASGCSNELDGGYKNSNYSFNKAVASELDKVNIKYILEPDGLIRHSQSDNAAVMEASNKVDRYFHNVALLAKSEKTLNFYTGKLKESGISYRVSTSNNSHLIVLEPTSEDNSKELAFLANELEVEKNSVYK